MSSPRSCWTSRVSFVSSPFTTSGTVRALKISGISSEGNRTSTTGPFTSTTVPTPVAASPPPPFCSCLSAGWPSGAPLVVWAVPPASTAPSRFPNVVRLNSWPLSLIVVASSL